MPPSPSPSSASPDLGRRLAAVRRSRGLTQKQVAERMGVTKGRVSQIEQGKVSGRDVLDRFARAVGGTLHQSIQFDDRSERIDHA